MLSQYFYNIDDLGIIAPGNDKEVVVGINAIYRWFLLQLIPIVRLLGEKYYDTKMVMHTITSISDVSLTRESQKHLYNVAYKHGFIDQDKDKNGQVNESGQKHNIKFRIILMSRKNMLNFFVIQTSFYHCHFVVHTQNQMV